MTHITFDQQRAAYDALGLSPERFNDTASILIEPHRVTVTRYLTDEAGRHYVANDEIASETVVLVVGQ